MDTPHKAGFVNILGKPNVGKSTLMNALVGERLSIITSKAQTTRHRIMGIVNGDDFQIVYSDTPGILLPKYKLQEAMMTFVHTSLQDADVFLVLTEANDKDFAPVWEKVQHLSVPKILLINKIDLLPPANIANVVAEWNEKYKPTVCLPISALKRINLEPAFAAILQHLPPHPPYFPKDALTDRPERFFVAEIVREKIFLNYQQEIPYATEVVIESFKESPDIVRIKALLLVERNTQKSILIGKGGAMLKKVGSEARADIETFLEQKVFLELFVKVEEKWRDSERWLRNLGYKG
ncbi:MAG: GTPase Era [Sphingobacteriales bacterium]|nr:GTPase Era [Sphingobacteriales bacterium]